MVNLYSYIKEGDDFRKLKVSELLFSEYTCMQEETKFGIWSDCNYFAYVTSGKKAWRTIYHNYEANDGDILFIKKGANLTHQFFDDEFCAIFLFIPDQFITSFLQNYSIYLESSQLDLSGQDAVLRVHPDQLLSNYFSSIRSFFSLDEIPDVQLLKLKFEELLLSIFNNKTNQHLTNYFQSLCQDQKHHMSRIMEENFAYNLKIDAYAKLCNMSLSSFKSAFKKQYNNTPAAWIKERKLNLALEKLLTSDLSINQLSFECGFEDPSHFIRLFKQKHALTPLQYRQKHLK